LRFIFVVSNSYFVPAFLYWNVRRHCQTSLGILQSLFRFPELELSRMYQDKDRGTKTTVLAMPTNLFWEY
jgi:hypothetical protein